jgi:hypothetical protein
MTEDEVVEWWSGGVVEWWRRLIKLQGRLQEMGV